MIQYKSICNVCRKKYNIRNRHKCDLCGNDVCRDCCYTDMDIITLKNNNDLPDYIYQSIEPSWEHVCATCMNNIEKDYIDEIPTENLPLYINKEWYFDENKAYFNQKLGKIQGVPK